jgi:hypothetical protein
MPICPTCRVLTVRQPNGLYKCQICGFSYKPGQATPLMSKFLPQNGATLKSQGDQDLDVFIDKLTRKLLPIYKDYPQHIKDVSYGNREKIKAAFLKVTDGKMTFKKWFEYIHTNLGKHPVDLANMLVACTEGLNSAEIKEFRQGAQQFQQYVAQMYNAGSSGI